LTHQLKGIAKALREHFRAAPADYQAGAATRAHPFGDYQPRLRCGKVADILFQNLARSRSQHFGS
jgi:hypothetical protein